MHTCEKLLHGHTKLKATLALVAVAALATLSGGLAQARHRRHRQLGGSQARAGKARLVHGKAIAPSDAPRRVVRVIDAANRIAKGKHYCYGGGHGELQVELLRLLRLGQLRAARRPPAPPPDGLQRAACAGVAGQGQVDHGLRQRGPRLHEGRGAAIRHLDDQRARVPAGASSMRSGRGFTKRHKGRF